MDRRKYLKSFTLGTLGAGALLQSCDTEKKPEVKQEAGYQPTIDRTPEEKAYEEKLLAENFFDEHEIKTITVLSDIIIPKDEVSASASEAGVPEFIEFIVKDMPHHQVPLRGGLRWLDLQSMKRFGADFITVKKDQQLELIDDIAYPEQAKPEMAAGVAFFNRMRDLTATGFFTSKVGIADLGYAGNRPNQWDGVPEEVLKQYGMKYDDRTLEISVKFES